MYVKLFSSIYQGTLRGNAHGLLVFTNLLAHADEEGVVDLHPKAIAEEVGITVEEVRATLDMLESPDPESRSPEDEGRRISRIDEHRSWGWKITNHAKYAAIRKAEDRKAQVREAVQRHRARKNVIICNHEKSHEIKSNLTLSKKAHQDIDQDQDISIYARKGKNGEEGQPEGTPQASPGATDGPTHEEKADRANLAKPDPAICEEIYQAYPRHEAKKRAIAEIARAITRHDPARVLAQTRAYARQQRSTERKYIPFAEKWFGEERYLDQWTQDEIDQSAEALQAAIAEGESMFNAGKTYADVMSHLHDQYGEFVAGRAQRQKGWKR